MQATEFDVRETSDAHDTSGDSRCRWDHSSVTRCDITGAAGAPFALADATSVSMDFNPVVDRIRVVSAADENFRINPNTGTVVMPPDTNLAYDAGDVNAGTDPIVTGIGYSNDFAGASVTTLNGIDDDLDILVRSGIDGSPSPNGGQLFTVGSLGANPTLGRVALDINANNTAFAMLEIGGFPQLHTINLNTGAADLVAGIGSPNVVIDIAVQPLVGPPPPQPSAAPAAFGNVNCSGGINSVDALLVLRSNTGLSVTQTEPCINIGVGPLPNNGLQGDVDCSNSVSSVDALKLLRYSAALSVSQNEPCPNIGT